MKKMKEKFKNTLLALLSSVIIIFGSVYANADCHDRVCIPCFQIKSFDFETVTSVACCETYPQGAIVFSSATGEKDYCCEDQKCKPNQNQIGKTQNPNYQNQFAPFIVTLSDSAPKFRVLNPIFKHYKALKTIPIYTIIQSFLI
ncbi:MAG: hypothetical protein PF690_02490 [Deltaproteobacteria bacterium]|jgi:hypothetical protein|nr:hypothetical protein [Deltaproteobacteria bacterium]